MVEDNSTPKSRRLAKNFKTFYDQMSDESDRGAVIVSVSLIDELLGNLLKAKLAPSLEKSDELFDAAFSPFGSFSAKIDLAYRIGLLRPSVRKSLHLLRKIRNNFAHASGIKGFDDPSTQDRIRELTKLNNHLLKTIVKVFKEAKLSEGVQIHLNDINDLVNAIGWRDTLQLIFASLGAGMADRMDDLKPIEARTD